MAGPMVSCNGRLIDGLNNEPAPQSAVVVDEGVIKEVRHEGVARLPKGRVIDLKGRTIMPGLIDAHVHHGGLALSLESQAAIPPAVFVHQTSRNLENDLNLGFTTLRDACILDPGFREPIDLGLIRGPGLCLAVSQPVHA